MTALPDMSFDHVIEIACIQTITILYKYFLSRMKSMNLVFLIFSLIFILFSIYYHIFLFIELRVRVIHVTQEERHRRY